eukprot:114330-Pelagomonas_calceolata.AAC.1
MGNDTAKTITAARANEDLGAGSAMTAMDGMEPFAMVQRSSLSRNSSTLLELCRGASCRGEILTAAHFHVCLLSFSFY